MADPICRWRNSSIKQALEFNTLFPFGTTERIIARQIVEKRWGIIGGNNFFTTPYQLAAQMGMYYEDDNKMYVRFSRLVILEEAQKYMHFWGKRYYAPNPYTKSLLQTERPIIINNFLVNWCLKNEDARFSDALKEMFLEQIGNTDILINMLNNFSEVSIDNDIMTLKREAPAMPYDNVYLEIDKNDKKYFFDFMAKGFNEEFINNYNSKYVTDVPLQQIFYGAPGTGKSRGIEKLIEEHNIDKNENVFRTTFHPDSDYSTFVGAYKPTKEKKPVRNVAGDIVKDGGEEVYEDTITYKFIPQAFLKAYIKAWQTPTEPVILVIEEINRGNCAQIFGDLFQLLDRKDGKSEYPIKADEDICKFLKEEYGEDFEGIANDELCLPPNLYIWATMNTSDQSLFPIDSAFKRRWDWKYMPIDTAKENWAISVNGNSYSWTSFLDKINAEIYETTQSEDKQLGFYFCKAKNNVISAEKFVSKVLFYIYNDVFKDMGFDRDFFRKNTTDSKEGDAKITFRDFFKSNGDIKETVVAELLKNLGVEIVSLNTQTNDVVEDEEDDEEEATLEINDDNSNTDRTRYTFDGNTNLSKKQLGENIVLKYIDNHKELTFDQLNTILHFDNSVKSQHQYKGIVAKTAQVTGSYSRCYGQRLTSSDGVAFYVLIWWSKYNINFIIKFAEQQGWAIEAEN